MFEKLHKYIGKSVEALVSRPDAPHVFRLHKKARCAALLTWAAGAAAAAALGQQQGEPPNAEAPPAPNSACIT